MRAVTERRLGVGLTISATHVGHREASAADVHGDLLSESITVLIDVQEKECVVSEVVSLCRSMMLVSSRGASKETVMGA